jgi:hypothetical protein
LRSELTSKLFTTHGETDSIEYRVWSAMMNRCHYSKRGRDRANYQARGIIVCEHWKTFDNFLADMGRRPSAKHSLDRIDNDGNYEPGNCRWATAKQQSNNQRRRVSTITKLAATLLALGHIPYEHAKQMTAHQIISLYHFDHGILHSFGPIDEPWNLRPRLIQGHREKTKKDQSIVAKTKRIDAKWRTFLNEVMVVEKKPKPKSRWPKRPFSKQKKGDPLRSRPVTEHGSRG